VKKHHPINNSLGKDDASSSEGFAGGTRLQRLIQTLKGLTGHTCGLKNPSTVGYDMTYKQQAIDRTKPLTTTPGRTHPTPRSPFSTASDYADPRDGNHPGRQHLSPEVGITQGSAYSCR
jgi:hypothetical protein